MTCRFRLVLPGSSWLGQYTRRHPSTRVEVVDRLELDRGLTLFEIRVHGPTGRPVGEEIRALPGVRTVEPLFVGEGLEVCRVHFTGRTLIPLLRRFALLRQFPYSVLDGVARWTVVGPADKVRALRSALERETAGVEIESVADASVPAVSTLTPRQGELLRIALDEGYFEVPRRITLTRLAGRVGVAVSTLSVALAVIERKAVEAQR